MVKAFDFNHFELKLIFSKTSNLNRNYVYLAFYMKD